MTRLADPRVVEILSTFDRVVSLVAVHQDAINSPEIPAVLALEAMVDLPYEDAHVIEHWSIEQMRFLLAAFLTICPDEDVDFAVEQVRKRVQWVAHFVPIWLCEHHTGRACQHEHHTQEAA